MVIFVFLFFSGGENDVAIDLIVRHVRTQLEQVGCWPCSYVLIFEGVSADIYFKKKVSCKYVCITLCPWVGTLMPCLHETHLPEVNVISQ